MTGWCCADCDEPVSVTAPTCPRCGTVLDDTTRIPQVEPPADPVPVPPTADPGRAGSARLPDPPAGGPQPPPDTPGSGTSQMYRNCPNPRCERPLPRPDAWLCPACMTEIPPAGADRSAGGAADRSGRRVELRFATGVVAIAAGSEAVIGRLGSHGSDQVLADLDQVSRVHALVRVPAEGSAQVRDEGSTNGTFVDGEQVHGDWRPLPDGVQLRLGEDVPSEVRYRQ